MINLTFKRGLGFNRSSHDSIKERAKMLTGFVCLIPLLELKLYLNCKIGVRENNYKLKQNRNDRVFELLDRAANKYLRRENELEPIAENLSQIVRTGRVG